MPVKIHGRDYYTVAERLGLAHGAGLQAVTTTLEYQDGQRYIVRAMLTMTDGRTFSGYAEQSLGDHGVAGQEPLEVAETSAVGRALAFAGFGSSESIASADEVTAAETKAKPQPSNGNGKAKAPDPMTAFWSTVKAKGLPSGQGQAILAKNAGDPVMALADLETA